MKLSLYFFLKEYKLLHPVVSKHEREKQKRQKEKQKLLEQFDEIEVKAGKNVLNPKNQLTSLYQGRVKIILPNYFKAFLNVSVNITKFKVLTKSDS